MFWQVGVMGSANNPNWLCRLGMHRPAERKVFHRGHSFTCCSDCGTTLIRSHRGWTPLPPNKQVTWRAVRPEDRNFSFARNGQRARLGFHPLAILRGSGRSVWPDR